MSHSDASVDVRTAATLALEGYRERLTRVLDLVDDSAAGRVDLPLDPEALGEVIGECTEYVLAGHELLTSALSALDTHMAKVRELQALDTEVLALSRALRERCEQRTRRLAEFDAAVLNARRCLERIDHAAAQPTDLDTLVRSAERLGYTRAPSRAFLSGSRRDIAPMLPGRPGDAEQRVSLLFELQALAAAPSTEREHAVLLKGEVGGAALPHLHGDVLACLVAPLSGAGIARSAAGSSGSAMGGAWLDERRWFGLANAAAAAVATAAQGGRAADAGPVSENTEALQDGDSTMGAPRPLPSLASSAASAGVAAGESSEDRGARSGGQASMVDGPAAPAASASSDTPVAAFDAGGASAAAAAAVNAPVPPPLPPSAAFPPAVLAAMAEAGFPPGWRLGDSMPAGLRGLPPSLAAALRAARQQQQQQQQQRPPA